MATGKGLTNADFKKFEFKLIETSEDSRIYKRIIDDEHYFKAQTMKGFDFPITFFLDFYSSGIQFPIYDRIGLNDPDELEFFLMRSERFIDEG